MRVFQLFFIVSILVLVSCNQDPLINMNSEEKQIIFFYEDSREADFDKEAPYYSAIIELRNLFPVEFENMILATPKEAKKFEKYCRVRDFPTLLVIYQREVLVQIDGEKSKDEIMEPMITALNSTS